MGTLAREGAAPLQMACALRKKISNGALCLLKSHAVHQFRWKVELIPHALLLKIAELVVYHMVTPVRTTLEYLRAAS